VQVAVLKVPVLLDVNVTVPVGVVAPAPEESVTVAVQVVFCPVLTDEGLQETLVVEVRIVEANVKLPLLPVWTLSPL
jgi:hypothetical protein